MTVAENNLNSKTNRLPPKCTESTDRISLTYSSPTLMSCPQIFATPSLPVLDLEVTAGCARGSPCPQPGAAGTSSARTRPLLCGIVQPPWIFYSSISHLVRLEITIHFNTERLPAVESHIYTSRDVNLETLLCNHSDFFLLNPFYSRPCCFPPSRFHNRHCPLVETAPSSPSHHGGGN